MTRLPEKLLESLKGLPGYDEAAFVDVHTSGEHLTSIRMNPGKIPNPKSKIPNPNSGVSWSALGFYLDTRPSFTFDPFFHAGCYYVQEASSMFLEQALKQTTDLSQPLKVLDLCAAPGGKSTHIQSLLSSDSLLVSNEVIRSRANILKDNIIKWGCGNVVVTNNDPEHFSRLKNYFDVIVVDAPCSGSGLFRRDEEAIAEWSENNVQLCAQRQQRILADIWPALKQDGILIYSTCSFSKEEDEEILDWISSQLTAQGSKLSAQSSKLGLEQTWNIIETTTPAGNHGYRFWPDKVKGEGFFLACFKKTGEGAEPYLKLKQRPELLNKKELAIIDPWIKTGELVFIKQNETVYAWPEKMLNDFAWLREQLRMVYSGTLVGELVRDKLVPDHALAMSPLINPAVRRTALEMEQAIRYLQRKDIQLPEAEKGWQLVTYEDAPLGWVNVLPNRVNNYYPKELRILKDH